MSRKVTVELTVRLVLDVNEGIPIEDVVDEMDYVFVPDHGQASLVDGEITDYKVTDSK